MESTCKSLHRPDRAFHVLWQRRKSRAVLTHAPSDQSCLDYFHLLTFRCGDVAGSRLRSALSAVGGHGERPRFLSPHFLHTLGADR